MSHKGSSERFQEEWIEKYSKKYGRAFWKNRITGEKLWCPPDSSAAASNIAVTATKSANRPKSSNEKSRDGSAETSGPTTRINSSSGFADNIQKTKEPRFSTSSSPRNLVDTGSRSGSNSFQRAELHHGAEHSGTPYQAADILGDDYSTFNPDWEARSSRKHNRTYWVNKFTNESCWTRPPTSKSEHSRPTALENNLIESPTSASATVKLSRSISADSRRGEKNSPMKPQDKSPKSRDIQQVNNFQREIISRNNARAALDDDDDDVTIAGDARVRISADGRWEVRYSRKSGKKYWRDVVSGETTWRLSATAVQKTPHIAAPATIVASVYDGGDMGHSTPVERGRQKPKRSSPTSSAHIPVAPILSVRRTPLPPPPLPPKPSPSVSVTVPHVHAAVDPGPAIPTDKTEAAFVLIESKTVAPSIDLIVEPPHASQTETLDGVAVAAATLIVSDAAPSSDQSVPTPAVLLPGGSKGLDLDLKMPWEEPSERLSYSNPLWDMLLCPPTAHMPFGVLL
jgi:WW domain